MKKQQNINFVKKSIFLIGCSVSFFCAPQNPVQEVEVSPLEDLMREHGVLNRSLLIYEEFIHRFYQDEPFDMTLVAQTATLIKNFIEEYHEHLEEQYVFPIFKKAKKHEALVNTLIEQHNAGRKITNKILELTSRKNSETKKNKKQIIILMKKFIRMYSVHAAREETVLFPALHALITPQEYEKLGDTFEDIEREKFGAHGFEDMVATVANIEKKLGIYDLSQFTPHE